MGMGMDTWISTKRCQAFYITFMACVLCVPSVIEIVIKSLARRRARRGREEQEQQERRRQLATIASRSLWRIRSQINWQCLAELVTIYVLQEEEKRKKGRGSTHMIHEMS